MGGSQNIGEESDNPVEINATAMVDVLFCLTVFFMCSVHFKQLEGKIDAWVPKDRPWNGGCRIIEEIRIFMIRDPERGVTIRKVGNRGAVANDAELVAIIETYRKDFEKAGRTEIPVIIDADEDVSWQEVLHIVDLCKAERLSLQFTEPIFPALKNR